VLQTVRMFFTKKGVSRYISHLDLYRCFTRALQASKAPYWFTEGFNSHIYLSFALPLSLGIESEYEAVDVKLPDNYDFSNLADIVNGTLPETVRIFSVAAAEKKVNSIAYASYEVKISDNESNIEKFYDAFALLMRRDTIEVEKKTKRGTSAVDIKPMIKCFNIESSENNLVLMLVLAAGTEKNLSPQLLLNEVFTSVGFEPERYLITRKAILDEKSELFK